MDAIDPTFPLLPISLIIAAAMLLLVLLTNLVRQNWNLGVTFLCFWLFVENFTSAINTIVWYDNADLKLYVYCDIASHLQLVTFAVKPMATLIITRRLYIIASLQSVRLPNETARRWNLFLEWTLGFVVPVLVAGPIYYINQDLRFEVSQGFGCTNAAAGSILGILIQQSWSIIPPLLSITIYYPKVVRIFYYQHKDINRFLHSNGSVSRANYLRILALASIDIVLTLPIGIVTIVLNVTSVVDSESDQGHFSFYPGWDRVHSHWSEPAGFSFANIRNEGPATVAVLYFSYWTSPILAFTIFGLFGLTAEARASYWRVICTIGAWCGCEPAPRAGHPISQLGTMEFGIPPEGTQTGTLDAETSTNPGLDDSTQASALSSCRERQRDTDNSSGSAIPNDVVLGLMELELDMVCKQQGARRSVATEDICDAGKPSDYTGVVTRDSKSHPGLQEEERGVPSAGSSDSGQHAYRASSYVI